MEFLVDAKADSNIQHERTHDKSTFLWVVSPGPLIGRLMFQACVEQADLCFHKESSEFFRSAVATIMSAYCLKI